MIFDRFLQAVALNKADDLNTISYNSKVSHQNLVISVNYIYIFVYNTLTLWKIYFDRHAGGGGVVIPKTSNTSLKIWPKIFSKMYTYWLLIAWNIAPTNREECRPSNEISCNEKRPEYFSTLNKFSKIRVRF